LPKKTAVETPSKTKALRARTGPIDPRKLEEELNHAVKYLEQITTLEDELKALHAQGLRRLRLIEAMREVPTLELVETEDA